MEGGRTMKWIEIAVITIALATWAAVSYSDTAIILRGTKVENWQVYENDGNIQVVGPKGEYGFGQTDGSQTWLYVPEYGDEESSYTVIQHDE